MTSPKRTSHRSTYGAGFSFPNHRVLGGGCCGPRPPSQWKSHPNEDVIVCLSLPGSTVTVMQKAHGRLQETRKGFGTVLGCRDASRRA